MIGLFRFRIITSSESSISIKNSHRIPLYRNSKYSSIIAIRTQMIAYLSDELRANRIKPINFAKRGFQ